MEKEIRFSRNLPMVLSKATGYGIKALAYMARQKDLRLCGIGEIAANEKIPPDYLRKILAELRRQRLVQSVKGVHGGYLLAQMPDRITLWDVFRLLDQDPFLDKCVICGSTVENQKCLFCNDWRRIRDDLMNSLKGKTIADYALKV